MSYDDFDSRKLSTESRAIVNGIIMEGLASIMDDINAEGFASEVFRLKRTKIGSLRTQLRGYLEGRLLCRDSGHGALEFCDATDPLPPKTKSTGKWRKLGTNPMAACLGLTGSALRHKDAEKADKMPLTRIPCRLLSPKELDDIQVISS